MYKYPWARVMCYQGGQGKAGRQQVQEVARYPNTMTQTMNQQYCGPVYPSLILPCNRIHLKLGGCSTRPGKVLNVLTLPTGFPLALSFAHCLSQEVAAQAILAPNGGQACMLQTARHQVVSALSVCLQGLSKFLNRIDCPIPLKEVVFHLLTDIIWTLCCVADPEAVDADQPLYTFPTVFVQRTQQELLKLYSSEVIKFSKAKSSESKHSFPPAESIGAGGLGRFSTYFQALLEFVVAVLDFQHKFHGLTTASSSATLVNSNGGGASGSDSNPGINRSASGSGTSGSGSGTIVFADSQDTPTVEASNSMPMPSTHSSRTQLSPSATPTSGAAPIVASSTDPIAGKKLTKRTRSHKGVQKKESVEPSPKRGEWLGGVNQAITLLRMVATPPESCGPVTLPMPPSSTHLSSRLVVVTGLPHTLSRDAAELAIKKVCKRYGGLYKDTMYLPRPDTDTSSNDQHASHAVLELRCGVHTSAVCSVILAATSLQHEGFKMEALAVNNTLTCGEREKSANKVLISFLRSRLNVGGDMSLAMSCLVEIFNASCSEGVTALDRTTVTGPMLRFFATFSRLCAVSAENYMAGIWEEFGDESKLLSLAGFSKCFEQDFMLNDEFAMRGVWLSLIECGYDLHLER